MSPPLGEVAVDFTLTPAVAKLSEVVVTATRTEESVRNVAATVSVVSPDRVRTTPSRAADELVRQVPGADVPRHSSLVAHPTGQGISIRGSGFNRTLVLLDGVPLNSALGGWVEWNRAPVSLIDHVEVLRGGGSSLFGTYAMGGVVQLFSKAPTPRTLELTAAGGSRD